MTFALHHLAYRNAGSTANHFSNLFSPDARAKQLRLRLKRLFLGAFGFFQLLLKLGQNGVLQLGKTFIACFTTTCFHFAAHAINFVTHIFLTQRLTLFGLPDFFQV